MTTHQVNAHPVAPTTVIGEDTSTDNFAMQAGTYRLSVKTQRGWRGGSATLLFNGTALAGLPVFTNDWSGTVVLSAGNYRWVLAGGVQGFVGEFNA